jgi:hypothetical protein
MPIKAAGLLVNLIDCAAHCKQEHVILVSLKNLFFIL